MYFCIILWPQSAVYMGTSAPKYLTYGYLDPLSSFGIRAPETCLSLTLDSTNLKTSCSRAFGFERPRIARCWSLRRHIDGTLDFEGSGFWDQSPHLTTYLGFPCLDTFYFAARMVGFIG